MEVQENNEWKMVAGNFVRERKRREMTGEWPGKMS